VGAFGTAGASGVGNGGGLESAEGSGGGVLIATVSQVVLGEQPAVALDSPNSQSGEPFAFQRAVWFSVQLYPRIQIRPEGEIVVPRITWHRLSRFNRVTAVERWQTAIAIREPFRPRPNWPCPLSIRACCG